LSHPKSDQRWLKARVEGVTGLGDGPREPSGDNVETLGREGEADATAVHAPLGAELGGGRVGLTQAEDASGGDSAATAISARREQG